MSLVLIHTPQHPNLGHYHLNQPFLDMRRSQPNHLTQRVTQRMPQKSPPPTHTPRSLTHGPCPSNPPNSTTHLRNPPPGTPLLNPSQPSDTRPHLPLLQNPTHNLTFPDLLLLEHPLTPLPVAQHPPLDPPPPLMQPNLPHRRGSLAPSAPRCLSSKFDFSSIGVTHQRGTKEGISSIHSIRHGMVLPVMGNKRVWEGRLTSGGYSKSKSRGGNSNRQRRRGDVARQRRERDKQMLRGDRGRPGTREASSSKLEIKERIRKQVLLEW
mmetsp:Transcript_40166/g.48673  ORF Transcript_40166/g.48673 Transcript_40166/m.48673 type:complete len:267 (+) Transcript_40166:1416-2216(+)